MNKFVTQPLSRLKATPGKFIAGAIIAIAFALMSVGMASATPNGMPSQEECSQNGFSNYGQCVRNWAQQNGNGNGYGGGNTTNIEVHGDFIINIYYFFFG